MNTLEKILFGSILWNYFFVSATVLLGLTTKLVIPYFEFFQIISIAVIILSSILITKNIKKTSLTNIKPNLTILPYLLVFLTVLTLCFLFIYLHTMFVEWDAISYYIPSAKAILTSQELTSQPYRLLGFFDVSPGIPIIYAWLLNLSSIDSLFSLPIIYFMLTLIAIFLIADKLANKGAIISILIFMSLPTVLVVVSSRALYLDMPFVLFFFSALYSTIRIAAAKKPGHSSTTFDYAMLFIAFTLLCFTRIEFGLFLIPVTIATAVFTFRLKYWRKISALALGTVCYIREIRNISLNPQSWLYYLQRLTPVIIVSVFVFVILKTVSASQDETSKQMNKKFFTATLLLPLPFIVYLLRNITVSGFIIPQLPVSNPDISKSIGFFNQISPSSTMFWIELLRWDNLVSVWWLTSPYLIPIAISLSVLTYGLIKKKRVQPFYMPALFFFAGLFILWSILSCDPQPRRLYYFAPFMAIVVSHGLLIIRKYFSSIGFALRVPTYIISITIYTLVKMSIETVNDMSLFYKQLYQPITDIEFIAVCAALFLLIFIPYETLLTKIRKNIKVPRATSKVMILFVAGFNTILIAMIVGPIISTTLRAGYQSRYQDYGGWHYYPEVVNYYKENISDNGVTMGFFCHELITFANRSTIDLSDPIYGMSLYSMINDANETQILDRIDELNVKYFLIPQKGTIFYPMYEKLVDNTAFGNIFTDNPQFYALKAFKYATLYSFYEHYTVNPINYSEITPWNYNPEENQTLTLEQNLTKFSATTNPAGRISIMYTLEQPLRLEDSLWLNIKSYNNSILFVTLLSNLQNRTTDYFTFQYQLTKETRRPTIHLNEGSIKGNFNPHHIEGILVGIKTEPNRTETFEISGLSLITYENT